MLTTEQLEILELESKIIGLENEIDSLREYHKPDILIIKYENNIIDLKNKVKSLNEENGILTAENIQQRKLIASLKDNSIIKQYEKRIEFLEDNRIYQNKHVDELETRIVELEDKIDDYKKGLVRQDDFY